MLDKCTAVIRATILITQWKKCSWLRRSLGRALEVHGLEQQPPQPRAVASCHKASLYSPGILSGFNYEGMPELLTDTCQPGDTELFNDFSFQDLGNVTRLGLAYKPLITRCRPSSVLSGCWQSSRTSYHRPRNDWRQKWCSASPQLYYMAPGKTEASTSTCVTTAAWWMPEACSSWLVRTSGKKPMAWHSLIRDMRLREREKVVPRQPEGPLHLYLNPKFPQGQRPSKESWLLSLKSLCHPSQTIPAKNGPSLP